MLREYAQHDIFRKTSAIRARPAAACLFAAIFVNTLALAQTTAPAAGGLDSLSDDRLISELASRGMTTLLERAFEVNNVPPQQRQGMRTLVALRQLSDAKLTASQRREHDCEQEEGWWVRDFEHRARQQFNGGSDPDRIDRATQRRPICQSNARC